MKPLIFSSDQRTIITRSVMNRSQDNDNNEINKKRNKNTKFYVKRWEKITGR